MWITNFDQIFAVGTGGRFIRGSVCTQIYTVFQKKFTLLLFAITKSDVDRFQ